MAQSVSFTRPGPRGTGQNDALVAALLRQVLSRGEIRHPAQGFDQLGKAALAAFLKRKDDDKETARQEGVNESFADFVRLNQGTPAQSVAPSLADSTPGAELSLGGGFSVPGAAGDRQAAIAALLKNPETASLGLQLLVRGDERAFTTSERLGGEAATSGLQGNRLGATAAENALNRGSAADLQSARLATTVSEGGLNRGASAQQAALALALKQSEGVLNRGSATDLQAARLGSAADLQGARQEGLGARQETGIAADATAAALKAETNAAAAALQGERVADRQGTQITSTENVAALGREATAQNLGTTLDARATLQANQIGAGVDAATIAENRRSASFERKVETDAIAILQAQGFSREQAALAVKNVTAGREDQQAFTAEQSTAAQAAITALQVSRQKFEDQQRAAGQDFTIERDVAKVETTAAAIKQAQGFLTSERKDTQKFKGAQALLTQKAAADLAQAKQAFDAAQPGSKAGKQVNDRRKLIREFGANSLELKNFDVLVTSGAAVNVQLADKSIVLGRKRKDGKVELQNADGSFTLAPPKSQIIGLNVQAATLGELNPLKPLPPTDTSGAGNVDIAEATGGSGFFKGIGNTISDAFGLGLNSPEAEVATNALKTLALQTTLNLADEVTGRPSKFIQEKILAIQASAGSILQGDARSKIKFQEVRDIVADQRNDVKALVDLGGLKRPDQAKAIVRLQKLNRLLGEYDNVLENFGVGSDAPTQADIEFTAKQNGVSVEEVKRRLGLK